MASIFTPCEGGVFAVTESCRNTTANSYIFIENFGRVAKVPITGFDLDIGTSQQFLHTLDKFIYVYSFGDRIGTLTFSGIAFADGPADSSGFDKAPVGQPDGIYAYYFNNRLGVGNSGGSGKLEPTKLQTPGGRILLGFLTGLKTTVPNPAYPVIQWALQYHVIIGEQSAANTQTAGSGRYSPMGGVGVPS